jgi:microcystin-dependent protein
MSLSYIGEIRIMSFGYAPKFWALCNGQVLPINQNQALFSILGTTYGGNGQTTFALPNIQARAPIHLGNGHTQGEAAGSSSVTVTTATMPTHTHVVHASTTNGDTNSPQAHVLAASPIYAGPTALAAINPATVANAGGSQPHENMQPYLCLNFCICLQGIFPSRN